MYGYELRQQFSDADLQHYFDGIERQRLDSGALSKKSGKWLSLREKLFKLPDPTFDVVMKSLDGMIENFTLGEASEEKQSQSRNEDKHQALALFERVAEADAQQHSTTATTKIHSV